MPVHSRRPARPPTPSQRWPLVITVLPDWLGRADFDPLATAADGFVLQVHSLERPRAPEQPLTLCDPAAARRAVERAGRTGVPFRVALATYGYCVAFDPHGKLIGLQADGPAVTWPADALLRVVRSDPAATAALVRDWTASRPASLRGIIWYRLPTAADALNWRWPTLRAVMTGRTPCARLELETHRSAPGLFELELANTGEADASLPAEITVNWAAARLLAADTLTGYELEPVSPGQVRFHRAAAGEIQWLPVETHRALGWLRFDLDTEVELHVTFSDS